jgi:hypothetical protein
MPTDLAIHAIEGQAKTIRAVAFEAFLAADERKQKQFIAAL